MISHSHMNQFVIHLITDCMLSANGTLKCIPDVFTLQNKMLLIKNVRTRKMLSFFEDLHSVSYKRVAYKRCIVDHCKSHPRQSVRVI